MTSMKVIKRFKMMGAGGNVIPEFRDKFKVTDKKVLTWFPGHMNKGLKKMQQQLKNIDCIIEVHDARVPISGHYADFSKTLTGIKPHIFVLNKVDLADTTLREPIIAELRDQGLSNVLFTNFKNEQCEGVKELLPLTRTLIKESNRHNRAEEQSYAIMIIGVPNVGKSSLINRLRNNNLHKKKALQVGDVAGITRAVSTRVKVSENPDIFILDTPGILTPSIKDVYSGLKLALVGCMQDHLIGHDVLADYLLFWLNQNKRFEYVTKLDLPNPSDDIVHVLTFIAAKLNKTLKIKNYDGNYMVKPDFQFAGQYFVHLFRKGELGNYCLDEDLLQKPKYFVNT